jgi:hypothetical protein
MAIFVAREGLLSLDKEQLAQLQAADQAQPLPEQLIDVLHQLAQHLSRGEPVHVYPDETALTIQQATSLFHILRPNLEKRLDDGEIPFFQRGPDRYIYIRDMIVYDQSARIRRRHLINEIQQTSEELGGYR